MLPSCVSGAVLHLTRTDSPKPIYRIHTRPHEDTQGVQWFADPRGLKNPGPVIDWTGQSGAEQLFLMKSA